MVYSTTPEATRVPRRRCCTIRAMHRTNRQVVVGLVGGLAGALAMNVYARAMGDSRGHGVQPAQSEGDDSAAEAGAVVYRQVTDHEPSRSEKQKMGSAAHYAFGM